MNILQVLSSMDGMEDSQWTTNGDPTVEYVSEKMGNKVSRQDIINAAPKFNRSNMVVEAEEPDEPEETEEEPEENNEVRDMLSDMLSKDPMIAQEFASFLSGFPTAGLIDLEKVLIIQKDVAEAAERLAEDLKLRVKLSLSMTRSRIKREVPDMDNQSAIRNFIASQAAARKASIEGTRAILKGLDLSTLDPRAPIDKAMARRNTRGMNRPAMPKKG